MNKYYKLLISILPEKSKIKLRESQINWLKFRDTEFNFINEYYYNYKEGSMLLVIGDNKKMEIVKKRALEIKEYYDAYNY